MGSILRFNTQDVQRLVDHCRDSKEHAEILSPDDGPYLWLIKERGIYLMSSGYPRLEVNGKVFMAHCLDCDTNTNPDWWLNSLLLIGQDDIAEPIPLHLAQAWLRTAVRSKQDIINIKWEDGQYSLPLPDTPS